MKIHRPQARSYETRSSAIVRICAVMMMLIVEASFRHYTVYSYISFVLCLVDSKGYSFDYLCPL
jgi:hypothetical protein